MDGFELLTITHHFGGEAYMKKTVIPAGLRLTQHVHKHDHLSLLAEGAVEVTVDGVTTLHEAPCDPILIVAGKAHEVVSLTNAVWYCVWGTKETDPDKIDQGLIL